MGVVFECLLHGDQVGVQRRLDHIPEPQPLQSGAQFAGCQLLTELSGESRGDRSVNRRILLAQKLDERDELRFGRQRFE